MKTESEIKKGNAKNAFFAHHWGVCHGARLARRISRLALHALNTNFFNQLLCNLRKPLQTYIIPVIIFQVDQLAVGLISRGLTKGDRLAIWLPNSRDWILTQFAAAQIGLILVGACYLDK